MTEYQQLIRDSNEMPPVIRADYLEDHGYDIEAAWLRLNELPGESTVAGTDSTDGHAVNIVQVVATEDGEGFRHWDYVTGHSGYPDPQGRSSADDGIVCDGGGLLRIGRGDGNGSGYCSDPPFSYRSSEDVFAYRSYLYLNEWPA